MAGLCTITADAGALACAEPPHPPACAQGLAVLDLCEVPLHREAMSLYIC